jgi:hypothetical protein
MILFGIEHTDKPCPKCSALVGFDRNEIRLETVLPLAVGARAPMSRDKGSKKVCFDCASAEGLIGMAGMTFAMARIAVGNDRQEQLRLPGAPMGLVRAGRMRPSHDGDMDTLHRWQRQRFGTEDQRDQIRADAAEEAKSELRAGLAETFRK